MKKILVVLMALVLSVFALTGCSSNGGITTATEAPAATEAATEEPAATEEATEEPVATEEPAADATEEPAATEEANG